MSLKSLTITAGTILVMAIILTGAGSSSLVAFLSIILVFVLPGYALVKALFPGNHLEFAELVALTLGLSLAIVSLGGVVLHLLPWKLQARSWTILLGSITFFSCLIAQFREQALKERPRSFTKVKLSISLSEALLFVLAGAGVVIAFTIAYRGEIVQNQSEFTQLWILPDEETESLYSVGIDHLGEEAVQYRLLIIVDGEIEEEIPVIDLESQASWVKSFSLPEGADKVNAQIYRLDEAVEDCGEDNPPDICQQNAKAYREVVLWNQGD